MKEVNIETSVAGRDCIYMSLLSTLKNKVGEMKNVGVSQGEDEWRAVTRIFLTMHEVRQSIDNAKQD